MNSWSPSVTPPGICLCCGASSCPYRLCRSSIRHRVHPAEWLKSGLVVLLFFYYHTGLYDSGAVLGAWGPDATFAGRLIENFPCYQDGRRYVFWPEVHPSRRVISAKPHRHSSNLVLENRGGPSASTCILVHEQGEAAVVLLFSHYMGLLKRQEIACRTGLLGDG